MGNESHSMEEYVLLFQKKWAMIILVDLFNGSKSFKDFYKTAKGISPKVLNETLIQLEDFGLITKAIIQEKPKLTEYSLTQKGWETKKFIKEFGEFVSNNSSGSDGRCEILNELIK